jgi:hypothetical protein
MADVTTTFAAKDESFANTVDKLNGRLQGFQAETQSFTSKVGEMAKGFAAFAVPIAGVAAAFFGARGAAAAFTDAIRVGGELNDLAARTGETAGNLAVLQRAFDNAGASAGQVGPIINRLQRNIVEAGESAEGPAARAFSKLGLSLEEVKEMTPTEQLQAVARALQGVTNDSERTAIAQQLLGKSGGELIPLLRAMDSELEKARAQLGSYPKAVDLANKALDDIGDNFVSITAKAREFVTGALVDIAPTIARATAELAKMDFAAMGMKLSEALTRAFDVFRALWQNPSEILGLLGDYLKATAQMAGDQLISAFLTAGNALSTFLQELIDRDTFKKFGDVLANAFVFAVSKLNVELIKGFESALRFLGNLWNDVTGQGTGELAQKLLDVVKFFASDFGQAMINPMGFIAGKISSALIGATQEAAKEYEFAFSESTEGYIGKARAGWEAVSKGAGDRLESSATVFKDTLIDAAIVTADKTELVKVNLFGGAEAMQQVSERVANLAEQGAAFRAEIEAAVEPAEQIGEELGAIGGSATTLQEAFAEVFPLATAIKDEAAAMAKEGQLFKSEVAAASIDAKITANAFTGMSDRMNKATNATSSMLDKMRESFHFGQKTQREVYESARAAGKGIIESSRQAAAHVANQEKANSEMRRLEVKAMHIENARDRAYKRAADMEQAGQQRSAHNERMRADERYTNAMEKLRPDLEKGSEAARKNLEAGSENIGKSGEAVGEGGKGAGASMEQGGEKAGKALEQAADPFKKLADMIGQEKLALETTLKKCEDFLKSIDTKLPQHALSA